MKLYWPCSRKNTDTKDKEREFPVMKVVSIFCVECGALKRDIKFYKFDPFVNAKNI